MAAHIVLELIKRLNQEEKLPLHEANVLQSVRAKMIKGFTVAAVFGSGLTWIASRWLNWFNQFGSSIGAAIITGAWGLETSLNSWIDHVLSMEGSRIQKELESVIVQKFPDNRRMQLISKHVYSERVFDDSTSDQLQLRRWYWNFRRDNAAYSQSTPDSDNHSHSGSKQNDLESKQVPIIGTEDGITVSAPVSNNGICKTMVETRGYACEQHTDGIKWLLSPLDQSLAFILPDNGFDGVASKQSWD